MPLAVVTGANRGLGNQVAHDLVSKGYEVVLAVRDVAEGERVAAELRQAGAARSMRLDVSDPTSIAEFASALSSEKPIDALVNNAGASFDGFNADVARRTLDTNYRGPVRLTRALLPQLSQSANIVMVSSGMGELSRFSRELAARLLAPELDEAGIESIAREFEQSVGEGRHSERGFPSNAYSVSKALLNAFTRVLGRELAGSGRRVNAVCPGWVRTRMGGNAAPRSLEQGARGIVWAATLTSKQPNGGFFRDQREIAW
ncbi:MAG: SDR family NAD(P)-dependent oxidoreductase [Myxococcota bacterium]